MLTFNLKDPIKQIEGFQKYFISKAGNVYSNMQESRAFFNGGLYRINPKESNRGYLEVGLFRINPTTGKKERKWIRIHQLVANHFIDKPADADKIIYEPNHINGNKKDNRAENLEWVTRSENQKHAYNVLGRKAYRRAVIFDGVYYESIKVLGDTLGINPGSVRSTLSKGGSTYLGKQLKYA